MLTTIAKRIQSRLSRAGIKVSLSDIKTQCELIITDTDNPTEDQLIDVQNYFMNNATTLTVITTNESEISEVTLPTSNEILEAVEQKPALATTTKNELVATAANSLNIELSTTEIEAIATNFNASSDDFTTTLDELKAAILAFINHKVSCNNYQHYKRDL
jgi:transcriptional regulator of heat shock response